MKINAVQNVALAQKSNNSNVINAKKDFNRIDVAFMGNLQANEVSGKLSNKAPNLFFTPGENASEISFCGQRNNDKKTVLVTGGAGYIGSHCAAYLLENGYNVVVVDNMSLGNEGALVELQKIAKENSAKFDFYRADVEDKEKIPEILKEHGIESALHFAAFSEVSESVQNPSKYYDNNTRKSRDFIDMLKANGVDKLVFSSTAATFGEPEGVTEKNPITEETSQKPINPYGESKTGTEKIIIGAEKDGLRAVIFRYFNVAGARPDGRLGEAHFPESHLIPKVLDPAVAKNKGAKGEVPPFYLFGNDYPTKDGTNVRDYINVNDLARAHFLALQYLEKGGKTNHFNLGTGGGNSNRDVYNAACEATGITIDKIETDRRKGDPPVLIASGAKAEKVLGFVPQYTLAESVEQAYKWQLNPKFENARKFPVQEEMEKRYTPEEIKDFSGGDLIKTQRGILNELVSQGRISGVADKEFTPEEQAGLKEFVQAKMNLNA